MLNKLEKGTREIFIESESELKAFRSLAIQFSEQEGDFYTTMNIEHGENMIEKSEIAEVGVKYNADFDTLLQTKPFIVRNHINNDIEVFVQDKKNAIYLLTQSGKKQWKAMISGAIISPVRQLDLFNNGKLQYIFATSEKIYVIDRLGNLVENFPIEFEDTNAISTLSVIDYRGRKDYRIAVGKANGDIFLFNKKGQRLDGWNPRHVSFPLIHPLRHLKAGDKDLMIHFIDHGILDVTTRQGESYDGFPMDLGSDYAGEVIVQNKGSLSKSTITSIDSKGLLTSVNLKGRVTDSIRFENKSGAARFKLGKDALSNDYVIFRQEGNGFSVFNNKGEFLFDDDFKSTGEMLIQYYQFSPEKKVYIVTSTTDGKAKLYDHNGKQITKNPILCDFEVALLYYSTLKRYHLFKNSGSTYQEITIREN